MRLFLTLAAWLAAVIILAPVIFFATMVLAGPHSSLLPSAVQPAVLALGWIGVLVGPVLVARAVWRRHR